MALCGTSKSALVNVIPIADLVSICVTKFK